VKTIDEAIEYAAQHLPTGYTVNISIEKEGWGVTLELENDKGWRIDSVDEENIKEAVLSAVNMAKEKAQ
jgi:sensor histidine kinase YesM